MLDIGWSEMLVIAVVLIVVVGPKDLPRMLRTFGKTTTKLRGMAGDFRKQFDEALKEAELDDFKSMADDARKMNPTSELKKAFNPMDKAARDVRAGLDSAMKPKPAAKPADEPKPASVEAKPAAPLKAGAPATPAEPKPKTAKPNKKTSSAPAAAAAKPKPARAAASKKVATPASGRTKKKTT